MSCPWSLTGVRDRMMSPRKVVLVPRGHRAPILLNGPHASTCSVIAFQMDVYVRPQGPRLSPQMGCDVSPHYSLEPVFPPFFIRHPFIHASVCNTVSHEQRDGHVWAV